MRPFLLQLADSAFPTGGYAFSCGLEAAYQAGCLQRGERFPSWLEATCVSFASWELPFVSEIAANNQTDLTPLFHVYDAQALPEAARSASVRLGANWARILASFDPDVASWEQSMKAGAWPSHQVPVLAATLGILGLDADEIRRFVLWMFLRDQFSSAVRLGVLGPMEAASLHHRFHPFLERLADQAPRSVQEAHRSAPLWDLAQGLHARLYSRLFQS